MKTKKNQNAPISFPKFAANGEQAAAILTKNGTRCTKEHLTEAKKQGISSFRSSRIYFDKALFEWLEQNPDEPPLPDEPGGDELESKAILERRKLREQYLAAKKKRLILDGEYTANDVIRRDMLRIAAATRAALERLMADAPLWEGLPAADISERVQACIDRICADLHDSTSELYGKP